MISLTAQATIMVAYAVLLPWYDKNRNIMLFVRHKYKLTQICINLASYAKTD